MSRSAPAKNGWSHDWTVGVRVWIDRHGKAVLGEGRAELLEAIGEHRSITQAARSIAMSYRRAWNLVQEVNEAAGEPLVEAAVGGLQGGGARLTQRGQVAVGVYRRLRDVVHGHAADVLRQVVAPNAAEPVETGCLHVAAAISFQEALGQILAAFALHRPLIRVRAVYGASNELAEHLLAGSPGDLFVSAEVADVDRLELAGRIVKSSRRVVATNGLAVIGAERAPKINRVADLLGSKVRRVALAEPACPLGRYTRTMLQGVGAYEQLLEKAVQVDNSRAVLSAVASGAADAGVAFASDAARGGDCSTLLAIPRTRAAAKYVAAILKIAAQPEEVRALLSFFGSREARRALRRCGFGAPPAK